MNVMFENTAKIVKENKHYLYPLLLQVGFMLKIQELLGSFGLIGLVLSIFLITVGHSEVVGGLKVIHQEESNVKEDLYCGIKRFKELFQPIFGY